MLPEKKLCSSCGACAAICPKNCIKMMPDNEGFRYPIISRDICISCNACEKSCPVLVPPPISRDTTTVAAQNRNDSVRIESSSGGVFSALAQYVLDQCGIICAAIYNSDFEVEHVIIDQQEGLAAMRGAKYAQSYSEHCFPVIQKELQAGRLVLFVGTPCQTAGLRRYLDKDYEGLVLVDMICHGVPSPKVWDEYLRERQRVDAPESKFLSINLRNKETGWSRYAYCVKIQYQDGTVYQAPQGQDWFMRGFVQNLYLRPSCSQCSFKGTERCSDLTLGDCWGIWDIAPEFDDDRGTSLLLIHDKKGQQVWDKISMQFNTYELSAEQAISKNPSLITSSMAHPERERFFDYESGDIRVTERIRSCLEPKRNSVWQRLKKKLSL